MHWGRMQVIECSKVTAMTDCENIVNAKLGKKKKKHIILIQGQHKFGKHSVKSENCHKMTSMKKKNIYKYY